MHLKSIALFAMGLQLSACTSAPDRVAPATAAAGATTPLVVRLEYLARAAGHSESGVLYVGIGRSIEDSMLTDKTREVMMQTFGTQYLFSGEAPNTCFVIDGGQGFSRLHVMHGASIDGPLRVPPNAEREVAIELQPGGTLKGTLSEWPATHAGELQYSLSGSYEYVAGFDECLRDVAKHSRLFNPFDPYDGPT